MSIENENVLSLHQLTEYPPDINDPLYTEYSFFKLGVMSGVQYFTKMLIRFVEDIIAANPEYENWVLTAPPNRGLPTAANLLAGSIYKSLNQKNTGVENISVVKLYNISYDGPIEENAGDFRNFSGYSRYSWEERLKIIHKNQFVIKPEDFQERGVIFINDINVTGASQEYFRSAFAKVYPGNINWLYIIDCDKSFGRKYPQLENEINNLVIKSLNDFVSILAREDIQHTAKCISKIFSYNNSEIEQLLGMLNQSQRSGLWESIQLEALYQADIFKKKMELIGRFCN